MVKIFGRGIDSVVIQGSAYEFEEIGSYASNVRLWLADGSVVFVQYVCPGVWRIDIEREGSSQPQLSYFAAESGGDVLFTEADVVKHEVIDRGVIV